jgi:hypothetical protein
MQALASKRLSRISILFISALVFSGCGQGDGPKSIAGTPATPVPELPAGFCDAINFETLCEQPTISNFNGGATDPIDNPDKSGINTSDRVAQMRKFPDDPALLFGGTSLGLSSAVDFADGTAFKIKVWSQRDVRLLFKLEAGKPVDQGASRELEQTISGSSAWEELCYDFAGNLPALDVFGIVVIFDNGVRGAADVDPVNWTFYYDDIEQVTSCADDSGGVAIDPDSTLYSTAGDPDLVIPDDYAELTPFGSVSIIDPFYADDDTYSPVLAVTSGVGYNANVAQIGYIGFPAGFAAAYETLDFKVKGMPNQVLFVKLFDNIDALRINLTSSAYSDALGDGWFQISIPLSSFAGADQATGIVFESDNTAPMQFTMFLTDIGFSGTGTGGPQPADPGIIPDDVIYATDQDEVVDLVTTVVAFGTSTTLDGSYALDADFKPAFLAQSGDGYGLDNIAQLGFIDLPAGFATGYESFIFKIKSDDLPNNTIIVKLEGGGGAYGNVVLTDTNVSTPLGNGWYQVVLPMSGFTNVAPAVGVLFEAVGAQNADGGAPFSFLLTDIGFNNLTGGGGVTSLGVFSETHTETVVNITNIVSAGNPVTIDTASAAVTPFDGAVSLGLIYSDNTANNFYGGAIFEFSDEDLSAYDTLKFSIDTSAFANFANLTVQLEPPAGGTAGGNVGLAGYTPVATTGNWNTYEIPLADFTAVNPSLVNRLGFFNARDGGDVLLAGTLYLDDIHFTTVGGGSDCVRPAPAAGVELATNGDFEAGDLSCWEAIANGGTISADNTENNGGTWSAHVVTAGASNPTLKQNFLAEGTVQIGDVIDISFDMKGTAGAGGIIFPKLISEGAGGSDGPILQTIDIPTADWTTYTYSPTITADVARGITFEISVVCGAVAGCTADVFIDNVTVQIR